MQNLKQSKRGPYKGAGPLSNTIALYDFATTEINLKDWFYYILKLYEYYEYLPVKIGLDGINAPKDIKLKTFKYGMRVLEKFSFNGFHMICIYTVPQATPDIYPHTGPLSAIIDLHKADKKGGLVLCVDDEVEPLDREGFENFAQNLFAFVKPQYGIVYQREFEKGPQSYASGVIEGLDRQKDLEERTKITKWAHAYNYSDGSYKTGDLRDIYPLNFLSQPHLDRKVGTLTLEQWINSSKKHGELKKLADNFWSWWIPAEFIPSVREALSSTGIILCV